MDLLQEISDRLKGESERVWNKLQSLLHDATIGLFKQYQQKTLELVRITAISFYVHTLRIFRKHLILLALIFFGTMISAVAVVVIPVAIVMICPWNILIKVLLLLILGSLYIGATAWVFLMMFSEDKWIRYSGIEDMLNDIYDPEKSEKL